ncbi:hypothetical protein ACFWSF_22745 [Streptomyces sp. NPDC058611]|uniref:hypothetical protein n=1 Tax=unclassified Streptomyces TaxID=2593676 RepID=UPI00365D713C
MEVGTFTGYSTLALAGARHPAAPSLPATSPRSGRPPPVRPGGLLLAENALYGGEAARADAAGNAWPSGSPTPACAPTTGWSPCCRRSPTG